ncbi:MAG: acyltransferase family protein [Myxococcales bacterium]|nr:acyltransferase family protein [Myxococcales bacterium]
MWLPTALAVPRQSARSLCLDLSTSTTPLPGARGYGAAPYRPDIDGLRAVAVLPVILHHLAPPLCPGGFVGVDVFFVISGFVITRMLLAQTGPFSVSAFYMRRVRRLLPALLFSVLLTVLGAVFVLTPDAMVGLMRSVGPALLMFPNVHFVNHTGYFDPSAEEIPLLHTWSLGVEEQFYLAWPWLTLGFLQLVGCGRRRLAEALLLVLLLSSFGASAWAVAELPKAGFYLPHFRAWELGLGAAVAALPQRLPGWVNRHGDAVMALGVLSVIASMAMLDAESPFPGPHALPVTLGAAAMVHVGGTSQGIVSRCLGSRGLVLIGKLSYSLYLLHWPLFVLYRHYRADAGVPWLHGLCLLAGVLALAAFSYRFIEQPLRHRATNRVVLASVLSGAAALGLVAWAGVTSGGWPDRLGVDPGLVTTTREAVWPWHCKPRTIAGLPGEHCVLGLPWERAEQRVVLWGDSHAGHLAPLFETLVEGSSTSVLLYDQGAPFLDDVHVKRWHQRTRNSRVPGQRHAELLNFLQGTKTPPIDVLVLTAAWSGYPPSLYEHEPSELPSPRGPQLIGKGLRATLARLPESLPVHVLSDVPRPRKALGGCDVQRQGGLILRAPSGRCDALDRGWVDAWHDATTDVLDAFAHASPRVRLWDMVDLLCDAGSCPTKRNGHLLYRDTNHLSNRLTRDDRTWLAQRLRLNEVLTIP